MEKKTKREGVRPGAWRDRETFSGFEDCWRHVFLYLYGTHSEERHNVRFLYSLQRLRRHLFTYLRFKKFVRILRHCAASFLPQPFLMLISFNFGHLENSFGVVFSSFFFVTQVLSPTQEVQTRKGQPIIHTSPSSHGRQGSGQLAGLWTTLVGQGSAE